MIRRNKRVASHRFKIRKGDEVLVISGNDQGKRGKVLKVFPGENKIIVEGIHFIKRHTKANQQLPHGGIIEREGKIHVSNAKVIDPKSGEPTRIGHILIDTDSGKKRRVRVAKVSGEIIG
ncbi:MAG: 50S ribosomal protein L24 [Candidatus Electryonea clarkiae]|nr:50S ribosomal protein L24 [Candidatus Electryonea clarkiae]MDP8288616.1 50S ribosomal protein L24 [Candidatus Electryonea clarkiae]